MPRVWQINLFVKYGGDGGTEREEERQQLKLKVWVERMPVRADKVNFCFSIPNALHRYQKQSQKRKMPFSKIPMPVFFVISFSLCVCLPLFWILFCNIFSSINPCFKAPVRGYIHTHTHSQQCFSHYLCQKEPKVTNNFFILSISICMVLWICRLFFLQPISPAFLFECNRLVWCLFCCSLRNNVPKFIWIHFAEKCQRRSLSNVIPHMHVICFVPWFRFRFWLLLLLLARFCSTCIQSKCLIYAVICFQMASSI